MSIAAVLISTTSVATFSGAVAASIGTGTPTCGGVVIFKSSQVPWVCAFDDEFNGTALSPVWTAQRTATSSYTTGLGSGRVCYASNRSLISVARGVLNLSVRQAREPFVCHDPSGAFSTTFTGGMVSTAYSFRQTDGRFEVRAELPTSTARGLQETFWLWPENDHRYGSWPGSGEIDFAEFYSQYARSTVPYIHYLYDPKTISAARHVNTVTEPPGATGCQINYGHFNTYTAEWTPTRISIDVNGRACMIDNYRADNSSQPGAPFNQPFFVILTQALGIGSNAFTPGKTLIPATTQVDYVRVWR